MAIKVRSSFPDIGLKEEINTGWKQPGKKTVAWQNCIQTYAVVHLSGWAVGMEGGLGDETPEPIPNYISSDSPDLRFGFTDH